MNTETFGKFSPRSPDWDTNLRPEEAGRRDGEQGRPSSDEQHSEFEHQVRERLEAYVENLKREHSESEARLTARYRDLYPRFISARDAYIRKRSELGNRDIDIPFPFKLAIGAVAFLVVLSAVLNAYEFVHAGWDLGLAVLFGLIMALILGTPSYFSGMMFRQAKSKAAHFVAACFLVLGLLAGVFLVLAFDKTDLGVAIRLALQSLECIAMLGICASAYYSHDPDSQYPQLYGKYARLLQELSLVTSAREGVRTQSIVIATAARDRAQELIRIYRHHNRLSRMDVAVPGFFQHELVLTEIKEDDFPLQCDNSQEGAV